MNAAAKVLPPAGTPVIPLTPAERMWVVRCSEMLIEHSADIRFKRRGHSARSVTHAEFLTALQVHLNHQQEAGEDREDFFAQLVMSNLYGQRNATVAGYLIGVEYRSKLFEIAEGLLRPLAADGVIADFEDADL